MNCALYFGSFNPVHYGHLSIARYLVARDDIDEVRIIPSPKNPCKDRSILSSPELRLAQVREQFGDISPKLTVSDIEFHLEEPLYTIKTLRHIRQLEPQNNHILVIGADNIAIIEKWYKWQEILHEFEIWVYPRKGTDGAALCKKYSEMEGVRRILYLADGELFNISSTEIRNRLKQD